MQTDVHGKKRVIDGWGGFAFDPEAKENGTGGKFKIPVKIRGTVYEWKGCFSCPSTALASLHEFGQKNSMLPMEFDQLVSAFQASLVKVDPAALHPKFTISKATDYHQLHEFGGSMSVIEWQSTFSYLIQREIYGQKIVASAGMDKKDDQADDDEDEGTSSTHAGQWFCVGLPVHPKEELSQIRVTPPRGTASVVEWMRSYAQGTDSPHAIVLYAMPKEKMFGIGVPSEWGQKSNKAATKIFGNRPVFGYVAMFKKKTGFKLVDIMAGKKKRSRPEPATEELEKKKQKKKSASKSNPKPKAKPVPKPKAKKEKEETQTQSESEDSDSGSEDSEAFEQLLEAVETKAPQVIAP